MVNLPSIFSAETPVTLGRCIMAAALFLAACDVLRDIAYRRAVGVAAVLAGGVALGFGLSRMSAPLWLQTVALGAGLLFAGFLTLRWDDLKRRADRRTASGAAAASSEKRPRVGTVRLEASLERLCVRRPAAE